jgi:integrase
MTARTGYIYRDKRTRVKKWVARVTFTDVSGKRRNVVRTCDTKTEATIALRQMVMEIDREGDRITEKARITFLQASAEFAQTKLQPASYRAGVKVAGVRSMNPKGYLLPLNEFFGRSRLRSITHGDIESYKQMRLNTPTRSGKPRAIASVHRELELMRQVFNFARRRGWIEGTPFERGESLIIKAAEVSRDRIMTDEEELRLLEACQGRLAHLRPLIICAVDSAARRGELFKLTWRDIDFSSRTITLPSTITKTMKSRTIGMTTRMIDELLRLYEESDQQSGSLCFGITTNVKHGWVSLCKKAAIEGLRFHDLRHTAISRMIAAGVPHIEAMKVSGHSTLAMAAKYINTDAETARRAAETLEARQAKALLDSTDKTN